MDQSCERDGIAATVIELDQTPPPRRNVRRKLVQSTLVPHKSEEVIESNGDRMCDAGNNAEGDGDVCSSQGKKTRKQKERTPKNGTSKKLAKEKSPRKSTPKKSATKNGNVAAADQNIAANVSPTVPNLRLEAKLRAEEDSRMSAGKQLHPFFSSWKGGKKNQEPAAAENGRCQGQGRDQIVTIGPIHVFDKFQDCNRTIDWKNWTFCEQTSTTWSPDQHIKFNSLEHRPKGFDLNELPTLDVCVIDDEEPEQCASQPEGITEISPVVLIAYQEEKRGYLGSLYGGETDCDVYEAVELSDHIGDAADKSHELQSISCGESGQPRNSLWVDKYQPRSASQVCGNTDSVKLMNEWLGQWYERGFQPSKDFLSSDEEKSQDADYNCSESIGAEFRLKNVLLIIGPAGSGKSAAVHACAKEQGFKILESNASECRSGAVVRQKFGEALKSYSLSRSLDPLFSSCIDGNGDEDVIEVAPVLHIQNDRANLKPLILFEDVDICFAEDRGLISAIQQIAEKAKGPVILTTNDKNHGLPDNLERIEICFSLPSTKELLSHLSTICAAEEIKVNPGSLEQLTMSCGGDIRKAFLQLQFWFQSRSKRARRRKQNGDPDLFDHEAGHMLLPNIIGRDFPSQLSQFVESEIAKSLAMVDESYNTVEAFETAQKPKLDTSRHPVQESWNKLCSAHTDLKPYLDSEPVEAPQVLDITHQITNIFSEADVTHSKCLNLVAMEPMMNASGDLDTSCLPKVLEQMTSTVAQQGFRFLTNQIATTVSVPTSSANMVPGRGLVVDETSQDYTSSSGSFLDMKPKTHEGELKCERMAQLSGILESVVPLRSLKGRALHEYASFIAQISRADPSNLSVGIAKSRRRRSREAPHYLSMELSSEDIAFL